MGKKGDLSDFEREMVVGARRPGLSIKKTDLLGFSHTGFRFFFLADRSGTRCGLLLL